VTSTGTRIERALATRRRMVKAAYDLFCLHGYLGTTVTAVAAEAKVAVPTIYYTFGTKAVLLSEALGAAIVGFENWREPPPEPVDLSALLPWHLWWTDFQAAPTAHEALAIFIDEGTEILRRVAPLLPAMHGSAGDPDASDFVEKNEAGRFDAYREMVEVVASKPDGLRPELTTRSATEVLAALFSPAVFQYLATMRWSHSRCTQFFQELIANELLGSRSSTAQT
jgi:AcrR family transcriptional regulator